MQLLLPLGHLACQDEELLGGEDGILRTEVRLLVRVVVGEPHREPRDDPPERVHDLLPDLGSLTGPDLRHVLDVLVVPLRTERHALVVPAALPGLIRDGRERPHPVPLGKRADRDVALDVLAFEEVVVDLGVAHVSERYSEAMISSPCQSGTSSPSDIIRTRAMASSSVAAAARGIR